ncbi:MAG: hypothetical protein OEM38_01830, partial [Gammaproteobacteria bacterium]|nr:hypothetical protein [Gammaproteobacteria bacterium]
MNNYISSLIVRFISLTLLFTGTLSASESIQLHHSVAVYTNAGAFNEVTLSIHITNTSNTDFKHVKLTPSGKEFSVGETTKEINIGYLPAQSESIIQWTAS